MAIKKKVPEVNESITLEDLFPSEEDALGPIRSDIDLIMDDVVYSDLPEDLPWLMSQIVAEIRIVLAGLSPFSKWISETRSKRFLNLKFSMSGFTLSFAIDPNDNEMRVLLSEVRQHIKWVFGDHMIIKPVSELSKDELVINS